MASIKRTKRKDASLTIFTVSGVLKCEEAIHALEDFFKDVTPYLLWDFTDADLSGINRKDLEQIIMVAKSNAHLRKNGRTAFVVGHDLSFGMTRMYEILSEIREHPIHHHVFRDLDKAITWLKPVDQICT
jgi:hypothetical protein